jgi:DnaJ family protein C protein 25
MFNQFLLSLIFVIGIILSAKAAKEIYDPYNIFCGSLNCYDILGVSRTAEIKEIKKAYRKLSTEKHPDKNSNKNATEVFRLIAKANEVLTGNESRKNFDYYLDHPRAYFKVSGHHYLKALPKSPVLIVIFGFLLLLSAFFHFIQLQKYQKAIKFLKDKSKNNTPLSQGGTKHTMEIHKRACILYEKKIIELKKNGDKNVGNVKMLKDPIFDDIIDSLVMEVKIEGAAAKPELTDLFIIRLFKSPFYIYLFAKKYHKRYYTDSSNWTKEEKEEIIKDVIGYGLWDDLNEADREKLINDEVWKPENYSKYIQDNDVIDPYDPTSLKPGFHKNTKTLVVNNNNKKKKNKKDE